ncbi:restriction endonuclease subunit S [Micrococcus luteus]|uniref:restriction endonuclease subunit S n=1 Tax=Micrococcus luteus TaxID=1270 RepID=UPI00254EB634|nr:restriction endonuclease subunit S [Micrococcus luteus]MDK8178425.1 restriction endonuclease subunit S [Micrococcus luteus]
MSDLLDGIRFGAVGLLDVFESMETSRAWYDKVHLKEGDGENLYLSQTLSGNSVAGVVADQDKTPEPGNAITVTLKTQATFYQPVPFYTAQNFLIFRHAELDEETGLVLVAAMRKAFEKFSWGYGISKARLTRLRILVPVQTATDGSEEADWETMRRLGEALVEGRRARGGVLPVTPVAPPSTSFDYAPMLLTEVFETLDSSKAWFDKAKMTTHGEAVFPFVSRTRRANGIDGFFPKQTGKKPEAGNAITLGLDTQTFGYQRVPFYTGQNIQIMRHQQLDEATALVLIALMDAQMGKFGWGGNGATLGRLKRTRVMVPVVSDSEGKVEVDWDGMQQYGQWLLHQKHLARVTALEATS